MWNFLEIFFKGRNLMTQQRYDAAVPFFESFLNNVKEKPWIRNFNLVYWSIYTRDIGAMALNNLGAAHLMLGNITNAEEYLMRAISIDSFYPMPYSNLAIITDIQGIRDKAIKLLKESQEKGFTNRTIDQFSIKSGEILAKMEGRVK